MPSSTGKKPLRLLCPSCGKRGHHRVVKTDPANYHWDKKTTALFARIAGRDISYRVRTKQCEYCNRLFSSVEMPRDYLPAMINEIQRLEALIDQLQTENILLKAELFIESDKIKALENTILQLEGERAKVNTELSHLREGAMNIALLATELASRQSVTVL